jgi:long-chain acyl-CoA synthetase
MPRWNRSLPVQGLRWTFLHGFLLPGFRLYMQFQASGTRHLESFRPPAIFAANHTSHLDTVAVMAALPGKWRARISPAMMLERFEAHFRSQKFPRGRRIAAGLQYYLACGLFNAYPIPQRLGGLKQVLRYTGELTERGYCPLVYPEGIMTPDGSLQPFRPGVGMMAARLRVPVVPVHIGGLFDLFPSGAKWAKRGAVRVRIGPPLQPFQEEDYQELASRVRERVLQLAEQGGEETP